MCHIPFLLSNPVNLVPLKDFLAMIAVRDLIFDLKWLFSVINSKIECINNFVYAKCHLTFVNFVLLLSQKVEEEESSEEEDDSSEEETSSEEDSDDDEGMTDAQKKRELVLKRLEVRILTECLLLFTNEPMFFE